MILLTLESSADEGAVCIAKVDPKKPLHFDLLSHKIFSQIDIHKEYGGIFPNLAKREHAKTLPLLLAEALTESSLFKELKHDREMDVDDEDWLERHFEKEPELYNTMKLFFLSVKKPNIDAIGVTRGPGLTPALWVSINIAKALSRFWEIPLYGLHHMEGHIYAGLLKEEGHGYKIAQINYPGLALLISGGHTEIVRMLPDMTYQIIGETKDDAVGEAFDKSARSLGLPYPGGPLISKYAEEARNELLTVPEHLTLPRPMLHTKDYNFSFSGLKTSVATKIEKIKKDGDIDDTTLKTICLEVENAITEVLVKKVGRAIFETGARSLTVGGGVIANSNIRNSLKALCEDLDVELHVPTVKNSTDNALMIMASFIARIENKNSTSNDTSWKALGTWKLSELNNWPKGD